MIISHTMVCYRTSWDLEWKVFCFCRRHVSIRSADKTIFTSVILHLEKKIYRLVLPFVTVHNAWCCIPFRFSDIVCSLFTSVSCQTGHRKERRAQETERSMFCFLSFWRINFSFYLFLRSTTTFLEIRAVPSR